MKAQGFKAGETTNLAGNAALEVGLPEVDVLERQVIKSFWKGSANSSVREAKVL